MASHAAVPPLWRSRACETAELLLYEVLSRDFRLELLFDVQFLEAPVLFFELFHSGHQGRVHAAEPGAPLVHGGGADAQLPADLRHRQTRLNTFQGSHDLAVGKSRFLHVELSSWEILLLAPLVYRGDYRELAARQEAFTQGKPMVMECVEFLRLVMVLALS